MRPIGRSIPAGNCAHGANLYRRSGIPFRKSHGSKNRALACLLKSQDLLEDDVEDVLDCYFRACSIQVDCKALGRCCPTGAGSQ